MAYVIAEPCLDTKDNSCVEVCPVDCIHPTPDEPDYDTVKQLYIDPEECIDCDACVDSLTFAHTSFNTTTGCPRLPIIGPHRWTCHVNLFFGHGARVVVISKKTIKTTKN